MANDENEQYGRVAVVTGANSGLGRLTAAALAQRGFRVVLAVRDVAAGQRVAAGLPGAEVRRLDLADLSSVRAFAAGLTADHPAVDLLVNNAGVVLLGPRRTTADGFELHFGTNFLGPYLLTRLLLDALRKAPAARVVTLSSITHRSQRLDFDDLMGERDFDASRAYGRSKLADTVFGLELDRRLRAERSAVLSVLAHPGVSGTNLTPRAMAGRGAAHRLAGRVMQFAAQPAERGVLPQLHAATAPDVRGGQFFGPAGFREMRGRVTEVSPSAGAADPEVGRRLWSVAEAITA